MRHDHASAGIVIMLRGLRIYGIAPAVGELTQQGGSSLRGRGSYPR